MQHSMDSPFLSEEFMFGLHVSESFERVGPAIKKPCESAVTAGHLPRVYVLYVVRVDSRFCQRGRSPGIGPACLFAGKLFNRRQGSVVFPTATNNSL
jgi:hypothetical protein